MFKKFRSVYILIVSLLVLSVMAACQPAATPAESPKAEEAKPAAPAEEVSEEKPAEEQAAEAEEFNPDLNPDKISFDQLEAEFGPVPAPPDGTTIGSVMKNLANEFWIALDDGYQNKAEEYGITVDSQATRTETDLQAQLAILEAMMSKDYDAYLLSPLSNENLDTVVPQIKAQGLPIVNVNCEFVSDADVFVGSMQLDIGRLAGEYVAEKLGGEGKVAIIEGIPGSYTSTSRVQGFREVIESNYPGIEIVASQPADYEREKGMNVATNILNANPDLDAIYGCNDNMALGAIEAVRTMGKLGEILVIGIDGTPGAYESVAKGELTGTIDQFPTRTGEIAVEVLFRLLEGQNIPRVVSTPIMMIDASNISEYMN